jgi:hypothetical protein
LVSVDAADTSRYRYSAPALPAAGIRTQATSEGSMVVDSPAESCTGSVWSQSVIGPLFGPDPSPQAAASRTRSRQAAEGAARWLDTGAPKASVVRRDNASKIRSHNGF